MEQMVNKENIAAWVAALRSGKYKQGKEKLIQETLTKEGLDAVRR